MRYCIQISQLIIFLYVITGFDKEDVIDKWENVIYECSEKHDLHAAKFIDHLIEYQTLPNNLSPNQKCIFFCMAQSLKLTDESGVFDLDEAANALDQIYPRLIIYGIHDILKYCFNTSDSNDLCEKWYKFTDCNMNKTWEYIIPTTFDTYGMVRRFEQAMMYCVRKDGLIDSDFAREFLDGNRPYTSCEKAKCLFYCFAQRVEMTDTRGDFDPERIAPVFTKVFPLLTKPEIDGIIDYCIRQSPYHHVCEKWTSFFTCQINLLPGKSGTKCKSVFANYRFPDMELLAYMLNTSKSEFIDKYKRWSSQADLFAGLSTDSYTSAMPISTTITVNTEPLKPNNESYESFTYSFSKHNGPKESHRLS